MVTLRTAALTFLCLIPFEAKADCVSLTRGPIILDVRSCGYLKPEATFDTSKNRYAFIKSLPAKEQQKFWNSYRGMVIKGLVVKSEATHSGLSQATGALSGEEISVFVAPGTSPMQCKALLENRLQAHLDEACCEGGGNPPCLLASAFTIKDISVISKAGGNVPKPQAAGVSPYYKKAEDHLRQREFKLAIETYEKAALEKELDIKGLYFYALALRMDDRCSKAIDPLRKIEDLVTKKEFWAIEEDFARKAHFLLARCYAMMNRPEFAVTILQSYLLAPKKYRSELTESLRHKDFGWIHTSKGYRKFKEDAEKALAQ